MLTICNKWFPIAERYPLRNHCKGKEEKWICKRKPIIFSKSMGFLYERGRFEGRNLSMPNPLPPQKEAMTHKEIYSTSSKIVQNCVQIFFTIIGFLVCFSFHRLAITPPLVRWAGISAWDASAGSGRAVLPIRLPWKGWGNYPRNFPDSSVSSFPSFLSTNRCFLLSLWWVGRYLSGTCRVLVGRFLIIAEYYPHRISVRVKFRVGYADTSALVYYQADATSPAFQ